MHMQISLFLRYWNVGRARQAQIVLDKRSHHVWYNKFVHDSILLITNIWTHRFSNLDTFASPHFDLTFLYINLLVEAEVKTSLFMTTSLGQRVCCSCKNYTAMIHWTPHKPGGAFTNQNMKLSNLEPEVWICSFLRFQVGLQGVSTSIQYGNLLLPVHCSTHCLAPQVRLYSFREAMPRPWRGRWHQDWPMTWDKLSLQRPGRRFLEKLCEAGSQTQTSNVGPQRRDTRDKVS